MKPSLILTIALFGCAGPATQDTTLSNKSAGPAAAKPAAPCPTKENGSRPGYLADSGLWIRDCNSPLEREYFRVFTSSTPSTGSTTTAYLIPPPDGTPAIEPVCALPDIRKVLDRYGWCSESADPDLVNTMTVDDALLIAHALHERMKFVGTEGHVWPYPMPDDIEIVCKVPRPEVLDLACIAYTPREGMPVIPTLESAKALAKKLNELYGIR
ncbi:MAG TPA: hypothetical protein VIU61_12000 [Kofleriaceae bacterium]